MSTQPRTVEIDLPPGHYDDLVMAGGITLRRQPQQHARVPYGVIYVDIWQGLDPATGQLVQGWRWAMYYD